jgi:hypothetical protein
VTGRRLAVCTLFFIGFLIPSLSVATDDAVKVAIEQPQLVLDNSVTQFPDSVGFKLSFDARFASESTNRVDLPDLSELRVGVVGITWNGVESQRSDGSWRFVVPSGNVRWKGDTVFANCKSLGPNETIDLKGVSHQLTVSKSNLAGLGLRATIRMYLELSCKQKDGNIVLNPVATIPFVVSIPPLP